MSRLKKELNKTSQQKLKKFTKTLGNYEYITNANEFVEKFKEVIMWDIRSLKGCSERAITDYYIETITDNIHITDNTLIITIILFLSVLLFLLIYLPPNKKTIYAYNYLNIFLIFLQYF